MNVIVLTKDPYYRVSLEYIGDGVVLEITTANDVEPPAHNLKPHYFQDQIEAKTWMIKQAYACVQVGFIPS